LGHLTLLITVDGKISLNDGGYSVFVGEGAGLNDDASTNQNVGVGYQALRENTTGGRNTANGHAALYSNTTGVANTANGYLALYYNTTGGGNTALGGRRYWVRI
jgi:trimeric autotransporter adhesin